MCTTREFPLDLVTKELADGVTAKLTADFVFFCDPFIDVKVPAGFKTDFASIPRILWRVLPPWDKHKRAAVIHDFLYQTGATSRWMADSLFYEAMKTLNVPVWKRVVMWLGVRVGGARHYRGNK